MASSSSTSGTTEVGALPCPPNSGLGCAGLVIADDDRRISELVVRGRAGLDELAEVCGTPGSRCDVTDVVAQQERLADLAAGLPAERERFCSVAGVPGQPSMARGSLVATCEARYTMQFHDLLVETLRLPD